MLDKDIEIQNYIQKKGKKRLKRQEKQQRNREAKREKDNDYEISEI